MRALELPVPLDQPTLALGAQRGGVFAYGVGTSALVSDPIGDLDDLTAYETFIATVERTGRERRIAPAQVVCDLHPDYATTRYAQQLGLPLIAVQHHHAHFASAFTDARLHGPALGVIFDGGGYGHDGTLWGGEILVGDPSGVFRAAHLQEVAQPGGELAALEPWRMVVAHLANAGEPIADVHPQATFVEGTLGRAQRTSSAGRLCDAVGVLLGAPMSADFEGQATKHLEHLARGTEPEPAYPFELAGEELIITPMIRAIAKDLRAHVSRARIARRFHSTLVELAAHACAQLARGEGLRDVVLSGGVFANAIIAAELPARLRSLGLVPHVHVQVSSGDAGLAFGQLAVAAARGAA